VRKNERNKKAKQKDFKKERRIEREKNKSGGKT
jgi:hypothetical protein